MEAVKPWLQYYEEQVPTHLDYPLVPLHHILKQAAEESPNHFAAQFFGKKLTFGELYEQTKRFAHALLSLGVKKGDRVAIMLANSPQSIITYYGALMIGAVVVQTNPMYVERELRHQLIDSGAETIVCLDILFPKVHRVKEETGLKRIIVTSLKDFLPFPKNLLYPIKQKKEGQYVDIPYGEGIYKYSELIKKALSSDVDVSINPIEDLALLQYTGGTTGLAKGVMLTHHNLIANTMQVVRWFHKLRYGREKMLCALPFFHVYGMTVGMNFAVMTASEMILLPKFEVEEVLKVINKEKPSIFPGAPTMYVGIVSHPDVKKYEISSIEACISGAAPLPMEVQERFEKLTGGRLVEGYGLTEAAPVTHCNPIWGRRKNGSIGVPLPDTDIRIVDPATGEEVQLGEIGELTVSGPQVMQGYWNRPEETKATLRDGWLYTGDMATMDDEGYVYIVDRKKDMIIAGGFNIYPREVEEVLFEHEAVLEAVIAGVPDPYRGETVKAYIVLKKGLSVSEKDLETFCRTRLAAYKVPKIFEFRDSLPKTMVGKVLRRALIEEEKQKLHQEELEAEVVK